MPSDVTQISKAQKEVLDLLVNKYYTIKKIALSRNTSVQAVYKIINKLKLKGIVSGSQLRGFKILNPCLINSKVVKTPSIRLHGVSFSIKIIDDSIFYKSKLKKNNVYYLDNNTIRLFEKKLIVYISKDFSYNDEIKASAECFNYINHLLLKIENELGVILIKKKHTELKILSNHFAETNNELSEDYNKRKKILKVYTKEDGKLWFTLDNSFNLNEAETLHPQTAFNDIQIVKKFFNDLRDNENLPLPSEQYYLLNQSIRLQKEITENQQLYAQNIQSHITAIQELGNQTKKIADILNKLNDKI